ncbi:MAG: hypothetical protein D4R97_02895 [Bacteroidetes bacterium]|nr:MAG: hypothetical protein D4R97_02895 [Bacteroidota bacterium]
MKKILLIAFVLTTVMFVACKKDENKDQTQNVDYTKPENLSGTNWKCFDVGQNPNMEYAALKFRSTSAVEGWSKNKTEIEKMDWTGSYTVNNNTITFDYVMDSIPGNFSGTVTGQIINCQMAGTTVAFKKQ